MIHTLLKLKLLKLTLLGAFGAGVVATLIAKEMRKKKKTEDIQTIKFMRNLKEIELKGLKEKEAEYNKMKNLF